MGAFRIPTVDPQQAATAPPPPVAPAAPPPPGAVLQPDSSADQDLLGERANQPTSAPGIAGPGTMGGGRPPMSEELGAPQGMIHPTEMPHNILGRAVAALMGKQVSYQQDPQTGQLTPVESEQKPGQFWRNLLATTVLSGAIGEQTQGTPGQKALAGAGAAVGLRNQQDRDQWSRAQEQAKLSMEERRMKLEEKKADEETVFHNAQVAMWHLNQLKMLRELDLYSPERLDSVNNMYSADMKRISAGKGVLTPLPSVDGKEDANGKMGNYKEVMTAIQSHPDIYSETAGVQHTFKVDTTGLNWSQEHGRWENPNGTAAKMEDHTTHYLYKVSPDFKDERVNATTEELNKLYHPDGKFKVFPGDPKAQHSMPADQYMSVVMAGAKYQEDQGRAKVEENQVRNQGADLNLRKQEFEFNKTKFDQTEALAYAGQLDAHADKLSDLAEKSLDPVQQKSFSDMAAKRRKEANDLRDKALHIPGDVAASGEKTARSTVDLTVKNIAKGWKERGFAPRSYDDVARQPNLTSDQKIDLAAEAGVKVPYSEIEKIARANKANPADAARSIEAAHPGLVDYSTPTLNQENVAP